MPAHAHLRGRFAMYLPHSGAVREEKGSKDKYCASDSRAYEF